MSFIPKSVWLHETRILSGSMYPLIHGLNLHVQFLLYPLLTSICVAINFFHRLPRPPARIKPEISSRNSGRGQKNLFNFNTRTSVVNEDLSIFRVYFRIPPHLFGEECIFWKKCPLRLIDCVSNIELDIVD